MKTIPAVLVALTLASGCGGTERSDVGQTPAGAPEAPGVTARGGFLESMRPEMASSVRAACSSEISPEAWSSCAYAAAVDFLINVDDPEERAASAAPVLRALDAQTKVADLPAAVKLRALYELARAYDGLAPAFAAHEAAARSSDDTLASTADALVEVTGSNRATDVMICDAMVRYLLVLRAARVGRVTRPFVEAARARLVTVGESRVDACVRDARRTDSTYAPLRSGELD